MMEWWTLAGTAFAAWLINDLYVYVAHTLSHRHNGKGHTDHHDIYPHTKCVTETYISVGDDERTTYLVIPIGFSLLLALFIPVAHGAVQLVVTIVVALVYDWFSGRVHEVKGGNRFIEYVREKHCYHHKNWWYNRSLPLFIWDRLFKTYR